MKTLFFFVFIFISLSGHIHADCSNGKVRSGKTTHYAYEKKGTKNYDSNSNKHKGNRVNQLRRPGDGFQKVRRLNENWSVKSHVGSCAVLGSNKRKVLGIASNFKFEGKTAINPMLEMKLDNGLVRSCCWDDVGSDSTADSKILKNPKNAQVVVDLFDPDNTQNDQKDLDICSIKVVGYCMNEAYKGVYPKPLSHELTYIELVLPELLSDGIKIEANACSEEEMI
jgi:hypothetical protein